MSKPQPLFSIIVPAYNAEGTIERCLKSIIEQSFTDYEAIVINDGSKDKTLDIASKLTRGDSRFFIHTVKNGGVSKARNLGIGKSRGNRILFLDSDDTLDISSLEKLSDKTLQDYDTLLFKLTQKSPRREVSFFSQSHNDGSAVLDIPTLLLNKQMLSPCAKAYSSNIIKENDLKFNENLRLGEDLTFNLSYFKETQSYASVEEAEYIYFIDTAQSLSKIFDKNTINTYETLFNDSLQFCDDMKLGGSARSAFAEYYIGSIYYGMSNSKSNITQSTSYIKSILHKQSVRNATKMLDKKRIGNTLYAIPLIANSTMLFRLSVRARSLLKMMRR